MFSSGSDLSSASAQPTIINGSLVLTDQEDVTSVRSTESKNLLSDCETVTVPGPDIIPLPLKHRRKIIAIPVTPGEPQVQYKNIYII